MSKFTPGPWEADTSALAVFRGADQSLIADLDHSGSDEEGEANATLIAAAPELLEKLSEAVELLEVDDDANTVGTDAWVWLKQARELLAKADGRAQ